MPRPLLLLVLSLAVAGCASPEHERAQLFNADGVQLYSRGDYASVLESFDLALTLKPDDPALLFNVAQCYDRLGDAKRAEQSYAYCLVRVPEHADARTALVELYYRTSRKKEADRLIEDNLKQHPQSAEALILDARRLRQDRAYPQAQGRLQQAFDLEPQNRRALLEQAVLSEALNMPERALVLYERVLERDPNQVQIAERVSRLRALGVSRPRPD